MSLQLPYHSSLNPHLTMNATRREFLQSAAVVTGSVAMSQFFPTPVNADDLARPRSNRGRIYKADKGGGIGGNYEEMVAKLERYRDLGFDGIEGGSPDITDIAALNGPWRQPDFECTASSMAFTGSNDSHLRMKPTAKQVVWHWSRRSSTRTPSADRPCCSSPVG